MTKRYTGELRLEERTMRLNLKIMLAITAFHIMLVLYSAWYMPATAWTFISGGLLYIIFGVWFVSIWGLNLFKKAKYREEEWFPVVDFEGKITGTAPRSVCHNGRSKLLHPVVHLHLINREGK